MITKLGYRPEEAADVLGSGVLLDEMVAAGWLKPKVQRRKLTIYDFSDLAKCWARVCRGEMPPALVRKNPRKQKAGAGALVSEGGAR